MSPRWVDEPMYCVMGLEYSGVQYFNVHKSATRNMKEADDLKVCLVILSHPQHGALPVAVSSG